MKKTKSRLPPEDSEVLLRYAVWHLEMTTDERTEICSGCGCTGGACTGDGGDGDGD